MNTVNWLNEHIFWGLPMLALFIGVGVYFTIKLRFFQLNIANIFKQTLFARQDNTVGNGLTPFQTLTSSLALTIGTGNIVALGTAIALGGAGAVFWMWVSAVLGMATTYAENVLGVKYRRKRSEFAHNTNSNSNDSYLGGAFWYIEKAMGGFLAKLFAVCCILASFGLGNMTQINAMSASLKHSFALPLWVSGVIAIIPVGILVFGGARLLGKVTEKAIPAISIIYILGCLAVIAIFAKEVPAVLVRIVTEAFGFSAIGGGAAGIGISKAMSWGFRRGVFSNEAGLGSTVTMNAMTTSDNAHTQGLWATLSVFFDTIVICTLTALPILLTGADKSATVDGGMNLASAAFAAAFGNYAGTFVTLSVVVFAIATAAGWSVFGAVCIEYLWSRNAHKKTHPRSLRRNPQKAVRAFCVVYVCFTFVGAVARLDLVWGTADLMNGVMALINLPAIMLLSDKAVDLHRRATMPR